MTNEELASVVLLCTRAIIEVVVECTDGPSNMSGLRRVASICQSLSDYHRFVSVSDLDGLRDALGVDDETVS